MKRLGWSGVIGRQGDETLKRNGRRDFCVLHELVIMNTTFQHKDIHKFTWDSKGRGLRSIIDYFIVRRTLRPGVVDVRVVRGVELGSDHHLVLMKVRLKVKKQKKGREVEWKKRWSSFVMDVELCHVLSNNSTILCLFFCLLL